MTIVVSPYQYLLVQEDGSYFDNNGVHRLMAREPWIVGGPYYKIETAIRGAKRYKAPYIIQCGAHFKIRRQWQYVDYYLVATPNQLGPCYLFQWKVNHD